MDEKMERFQEKLEELLEELDTFENEEEQILLVLNSIIAIGQSYSNSIFEFYGILEEAKFLFREEMMQLAEEDDYMEDEEEDYHSN